MQSALTSNCTEKHLPKERRGWRLNQNDLLLKKNKKLLNKKDFYRLAESSLFVTLYPGILKHIFARRKASFFYQLKKGIEQEIIIRLKFSSSMNNLYDFEELLKCVA